jgi:membrane-associated phospholipid phosphatase
MKVKLTLFLYLVIILNGNSQDSLNPVVRDTFTAPYNLKWKVDIPITAVLFGTNYIGLRLLRSKEADTSVSNLSPDDINAFDRSAAMQDPSYSKQANLLSDISLTTSFFLPGLLLFDKRIRADGVKIIIMHLETQAIMANTYFLTMSIMRRNRPYAYNVNEDPGRRRKIGNNNSFFGGHAAHSASCSFFIAKVLTDYYPEKKLGKYLYPAAVIPPAIVGYFRYKGGNHFPTDLIAGTAIGATIGWLVPELHRPRKNKNKRKLDVGALMGPASGLTFTYAL